ncbi:hypothetical protein LX90_009080 [Lentzea flava]|nr:hypothetical protein [Lentzea flava]
MFVLAALRMVLARPRDGGPEFPQLGRQARHRLAVLRHVEEVSGHTAMTCRYFGIGQPRRVASTGDLSARSDTTNLDERAIPTRYVPRKAPRPPQVATACPRAVHAPSAPLGHPLWTEAAAIWWTSAALALPTVDQPTARDRQYWLARARHAWGQPSPTSGTVHRTSPTGSTRRVLLSRARQQRRVPHPGWRQRRFRRRACASRTTRGIGVPQPTRGLAPAPVLRPQSAP